MPRSGRIMIDGAFYHIINRGNARQKIFHDSNDYRIFLQYAHSAKEKHPLDIFAYCLMPNHFHFVISAIQSSSLSKWMHLLLTRHARLHQKKYRSIGHIWQDRFKNFAIQNETHLLVIIRYVEGNPVRAGLVESSLDWIWSSHAERITNKRKLIYRDDMVSLPPDWTEFVDTPLTYKETLKIQNSIKRQIPYGDDEWTQRLCQERGISVFPGKPGRKRKQD